MDEKVFELHGIPKITIVYRGIMLPPNKEINITVTENELNNYKDYIDFISFTDIKKSDNETKNIVKNNTKIIDVAETENNNNQKPLTIHEDSTLENKVEENSLEKEMDNQHLLEEQLKQAISKRESIVEQQEEQKRIAFERKKMEEVRPIPKQIKRKPIKK